MSFSSQGGGMHPGSAAGLQRSPAGRSRPRGTVPSRPDRHAAARATAWIVVLFLIGLKGPEWLLSLPAFPQLDAFLSRPYSVVVLDRGGEELQILPLEEGLRRIHKPLAEIPPHVRKIFLASEDRRFAVHRGVDVSSILRAAYQNLIAGETVSGASTVTMQLARIITPSPPGLRGKTREILDALRLEVHLSKEQILELWLNSLPFGMNVQGAEAASRALFGKSVEGLTPAEAALLAVIPRAPQRYGPTKDPDRAEAAARRVATRAALEIPDSEWVRALAQARVATESTPWPFRAPHFVRFVEKQLTDGDWQAGGPIITTLDRAAQLFLEEAIGFRVEAARENRISNGAGLLMENRTGEILAHVGSVSFFDTESSGQIDGARILRQPGSTLKPFLYALALESGFTAATVMPDVPTQFGNEEAYLPTNFNERFRGPVRIRVALASSLNVPAVDMVTRLGVQNFASHLEELGFRSLHSQRETTGAGIALGNTEVSLMELVRAFSLFSRDGLYRDMRWRLEASPRGEPPRRIYADATVELIRDIMADRIHRVSGFGHETVLNTDFAAIMKTGTSNQFNNIWALGSTPDLTCGVWMGNFGGETVIGKPGSSLPAATVVEVLRNHSKKEPFPEPRRLQKHTVCSLSGGAVTEACPSPIEELFIPGTEPERCTYHSLRDGRLHVQLPSEYREWVRSHGYHVDYLTGEMATRFVSPVDGAVYFYDPRIPGASQAVPVRVEGAGEVALSVNGEVVHSGRTPLEWFFPVRRGEYVLEALSLTSGPTGDGVPARVAVEVR